MTLRDATAADLPAIDRVFRRSFCDTFAHLYDRDDLAAFFASFTPEAWAGEFADARYRFRVAEVEGEIVGYLKLGPSALPVETDKRAVELRQVLSVEQDGAARGLDQAVDAATQRALARPRQPGHRD